MLLSRCKWFWQIQVLRNDPNQNILKVNWMFELIHTPWCGFPNFMGEQSILLKLGFRMSKWMSFFHQWLKSINVKFIPCTFSSRDVKLHKTSWIVAWLSSSFFNHCWKKKTHFNSPIVNSAFYTIVLLTIIINLSYSVLL